MERLTKRGISGITYNNSPGLMCSCYCDNCSKGTGDCDRLKAMVNRLAKFEDLEEQGLLVRLPDDLNRTLYQINYKYTECTEYGEEKNKCEIYNCEYDCDSRKEYYISKVDFQYIPIGSYYNCLGKTLFLTREEAEKKLKEMKND